MRTRLVPSFAHRSSVHWVLLIAVGLVAAGVMSPTVPRSIAAAVDWADGVTRLVSANSEGTDAGDRGSGGPVISPDGAMIAFSSAASNLDPTVSSSGVGNIYVRDLATGVTSLVSVSRDGDAGGNGTSSLPVFSPDSTKIAFWSMASNLDAATPDTNGQLDVYVRDLHEQATHLVSVNSDGNDAGNKASGTWEVAAVFSTDSRYVAFTSESSDLIEGLPEAYNSSDVYLRDLAAGVTTLVSENSAGTGVGNSYSGRPVFSHDGSMIAFYSSASDLDATTADTNGAPDVYVRDLAAGVTHLVSVNSAGTDSGSGTIFGGRSDNPVFSPTGASIAFWSWASDLDASIVDDNDSIDIYLRDLTTLQTHLVSVNAAGDRAANGHSGTEADPVFSSDGTTIAFGSYASDLDAASVDSNVEEDIFIRDLESGVTYLVSVNSSGTVSGNGSSGQPAILSLIHISEPTRQ